ncbi:hypothetical protein MASR1M90_04490 [Desulfovibrionales bacterium]
MSWDVCQTRRFARSYKKLHPNIATEVDTAVETVAQNPDIGTQKKETSVICGCINFDALASSTCWDTPVTMPFGWFIWKLLGLTRIFIEI